MYTGSNQTGFCTHSLVANKCEHTSAFIGHLLTTSPVSSQGSGSPPSHAGGGEVAVEEMAERLTQTEQLVTQLKEMIREKDAALRSKDDQLKVGNSFSSVTPIRSSAN